MLLDENLAYSEDFRNNLLSSLENRERERDFQGMCTIQDLLMEIETNRNGDKIKKPTPPIPHNATQFRSFLNIKDQSLPQNPPSNSERSMRTFGLSLRAMLDAATSKTETHELEKRYISKPSKPKVPSPKGGFGRMLDEAIHGSDVVENEIRQTSVVQFRSWGLGAMLEAATRGSDTIEAEQIIQRATVMRSFNSWGFRSMLDAISPDP